MEVKYPDVQADSAVMGGNAMNIIVTVGKALRRAGYREAEKEWQAAAFASKSYDELLQLAMAWVEVE